MAEKLAVIIGTIIGLILGYGIIFALVSFLVAAVCWAFGIAFSWKIVVGIFAVVALLKIIF